MTTLSLAEHVCLALVGEGVAHGWAVGSLLSADGELGRIWTLSRPLTYRAIDQLVEHGLVARKGQSPGRGRERTLLAITAAGRRANDTWLGAPIEHVRDVRTELLAKLELRRRAGLPLDDLIRRQMAVFDGPIAALGAAGASGELVDVWRAESARAVRRFLAQALDDVQRRGSAGAARTEMRLSARNQLQAKVEVVQHGDVMSTVKVVLPDGQHLTAAITRDAALELELGRGDVVTVIVKSTEVMIAKAE